MSACDGGDYDSGGGCVGFDLSKPVEMGQRTEKEIILEEPFVVGPGEGARLCLFDKSNPSNSCMVGMNNGCTDFSDEHLLVESGRISKLGDRIFESKSNMIQAVASGTEFVGKINYELVF